MSEWLLIGLEGSNPLAYLAAIGSLRVSSLAFRERSHRMRWVRAEGAWRPKLMVVPDLDMETWLSGIASRMADPSEQAVFGIADDLTISIADFRNFAASAASAARATERSYADFLAAFGSEAVESRVNGKKSGMVADTAFRTMSGAGHQHFLGFMRMLSCETKVEHLRAALFETWTYGDPAPSLRWDPNDDRRYALRWAEPSGDPIRTVRGANRLAVEGLACFPTAARNGQLETTGFRREKRRGVAWTWPIWVTPVGLEVVRSMLALEELQNPVPDRRRLRLMGIEEVYRSYRITQGKYRNFTMAQPV